MNRPLPGWALVVLIGSCSGGAGPELPAPQEADRAYAPDHARQVLDLWAAPADGPRPFVLWAHPGGFSHGDKRDLTPALLDDLLAAGISVVSMNYRYTTETPYPAPMEDGRAAWAWVVEHAEEFGLDPERGAWSGNSAGSTIALWNGLQSWPDLPRPRCLAVFEAQTSMDPEWFRAEVGGRTHEHPFLLHFYGVEREAWSTPEQRARIESASAFTHLDAGDPPVFLSYLRTGGALPPDAGPRQGIHHPVFGRRFQERCAELGVACILRTREDEDMPRDDAEAQAFVRDRAVAFLVGHLSP